MKEIKFKSDAEYHKYPALSKSQIKNYSPEYVEKFWRHSALNPLCKAIELNDNMIFGSACHTALLEPTRFCELYEIQDWSDAPNAKRGTKTHKELQDKFPDKTILKSIEADKIVAIVQNLKNHKLVSDILSSGSVESPFTWYDKEYELPCKCKPDLIRASEYQDFDGKAKKKMITMVEFKTTGKFDTVIKSPAQNSWHIDNGFYRRMAQQKYGDEYLLDFIYIIQSTKDDELDRFALRRIPMSHESGLDMTLVMHELNFMLMDISDRYKRWLDGDISAWTSTHETEDWYMPRYSLTKYER